MNRKRWQQIDDLFNEVLARSDEERSAFVRGAAGADTDLHREVLSLLDAHERDADFLDEPAHGGASRLLELDPRASLTDLVGARLGAYRITEAVDAGGMGAVYLAVRDDEAYEKQVAVKLVRRRLFGSSASHREETRQRFKTERQVLATLDHPFIARLVDGGETEDGQPYFIMEYVEGVPIDVYCEQNALSIPDRLRIFARVCKAVEHAHQNLVIHRDLKPRNILVTEAGKPKLLDFGLAKLVDPHGSAAGAEVTATGAFMGTFAYAAPEQVATTGHVPDTRSDVYALGMILYRLLTGRHAYDVSGNVSEVLHRITTAPPIPPSQVAPSIGDELNTIVLKALAKERDRRYQSVADLRGDVERYLRQEPILAKSDSGWYMLRKTVRRHRVPLAALALLGVLVTAFAVFALIQVRTLAEQKATLAEALHVSMVEQGRAIGMAGNTALAEQLIWDEHLADLDRGLDVRDRLAYWALWELYFNEPCLQTIEFDGGRTDRLCISPSGRWLVAGQEFATVCIDLWNGGERWAIPHGDSVSARSVSFHPNSRMLATGTSNGNVDLWDVQTRQRVRTLVHQATARRCVFGTSGRLVTAMGSEAMVWNVDTGEIALRLSMDDGIYSLDISDVANVIAVGTSTGALGLFDARTGTPRARFFDEGRAIRALAFSPDGRFLAADTDGTVVNIIDLHTNTVMTELERAKGWIDGLAFHPTFADPWHLAVASYDKTVLLWEVTSSPLKNSDGPTSALRPQTARPDRTVDSRRITGDMPSNRRRDQDETSLDLGRAGVLQQAASGRLIRTFHGHDAPVGEVCFSPDGKILYTGAQEPTIKVWELTSRAGVRRWDTSSSVFDLHYSVDGMQIFVAGGDGDWTIRARDVGTGALADVFEGHENVVASLAPSPDGTRLASGSYDGTIRVWSLEDATRGTTVWQQHVGRSINSITWAPDGDVIAAAGEDCVVDVRSAVDGALVEELALGCHRIPSLRYSPDGRFLCATLQGEETTALIDRTTGARHELTGHEQRIRIARFSHDGSLLATAADDLVIKLWSMRDRDFGRLVAELRGHRQDVFALAFSPDGRLLASGTRGGDVKLWQVDGARCLVTLSDHEDMVFSVTFSPDGRKLVSGGRDRTIRQWDLGYYAQHVAGNLESQRLRRARQAN